MWAQAKNVPTADVFKATPCDAGSKLEWLKRHDKESGNLYGMLPLIHGMPVVLTDHLDRNPGKNLLRGSRGRIQHWVMHAEESSTYHDSNRNLQQLPVSDFVKFDDASWTLPPLTEPGLYPIQKTSGEWFLDKNRAHPVLKVRRHQLPLAPGFAMTAHASQGQTLATAIVDLQTPGTANTLTSYVALSRVRDRSSILIFRPFSVSICRGGPPEGPTTLLQKLRG